MIKKAMLIASFLVIPSCGQDVSQQQDPPPINNGGGGGNGGGGDGGSTKTSFAEVQQLHQQYCIQCHANSAFTRDEQSLKNSSAKQRVQNGSMPPPNGPSMGRAAREKYLNFFSG